MNYKLFITAICCAVIIGLFSIISGDHKPTYCYADANNDKRGYIWLYQNVDWYPDNELGIYTSLEHIKYAVDVYKCPLGHQE